MAKFGGSPFRFAQGKKYENESYLLKQLLTPYETTLGLASSADWFVAPYGTEGSLIALPSVHSKWTRTSDPKFISAHGAAVTGIDFNPFNDNQFASTSLDGTVKIWSIPKGVLTENLSSSDFKISGIGDSGFSLKYHPSTSGVIAVGAKSAITIIDAEKGEQKYQHTLEGSGKDVVSVAWNYDGSLLAGLGKNSALHLYDPRVAPSDQLTKEKKLEKFRKPHHVLFIGKQNKGKLLLLGQDKTLKPTYEVYDPAKLDKPESEGILSSSSGFTLPAYDPDTEHLYIGLRGSSIITLYDVSEAKKTFPFTTVSQLTTSDSIKGYCLLNKRGLKFKSFEVNRVLAVSDGQVGSYGVIVTRKTPGFHADLFPDTAGPVAAQTSEAYYEGKNANPALISVERWMDSQESGSTGSYTSPASPRSPTSPTSPASPTSPKSPGVFDKKEDKKAESLTFTEAEKKKEAEKIEEIKKTTYSKTQTRAQIDSKLKGSLYRHLSGKESNEKRDWYYDLKTDKSLPYNRNIRNNLKFLAMPWATGGGSSLLVWPLKETGRVGTGKFLHGHKTQVTAFDVSNHDQHLIVSAAQEAAVKLYKIPEGGLKEDISTPIKEFTVEGKISFLQFHPYVPDVIVTAVTGFESTEIQFWNINSDTTSSSIKITLDAKVGSVEDISFESNCKRIAVATKDGSIRIYDPRENKELKVFKPENSQRGLQVIWLNSTHVLTFGFRSGSRRTISVYNIDDGKSKKDIDVDTGNALMLPYYDPDSQLLLIGSVGGNFIRFFQITEKEPYIEFLNMFQSKGDVTGWSFSPKSSVNVKEVEMFRCLKLTKENIIPVIWTIPRKRLDYFQDDLYPHTLSIPVLSASEFFSGVEGSPNYYSLQPEGMGLLSTAPAEELTEREMKYRAHLAGNKSPKAVGATGHSSTSEVREHFQEVAKVMPKKNRWDAEADEQDDGNDDDWD